MNKTSEKKGWKSNSNFSWEIPEISEKFIYWTWHFSHVSRLEEKAEWGREKKLSHNSELFHCGSDFLINIFFSSTKEWNSIWGKHFLSMCRNIVESLTFNRVIKWDYEDVKTFRWKKKGLKSNWMSLCIVSFFLVLGFPYCFLPHLYVFHPIQIQVGASSSYFSNQFI